MRPTRFRVRTTLEASRPHFGHSKPRADVSGSFGFMVVIRELRGESFAGVYGYLACLFQQPTCMVSVQAAH